jgi:hypothetical protein
MNNTKAVELIKEYGLFEELQDDVLKQYDYVGKHDVNLTDYILYFNKEKLKQKEEIIKQSLQNRLNYRHAIKDWAELYRKPHQQRYEEGFNIIYDQMIYLLEEEIEIDWVRYEEEVHRINDLMVKEAKDYINAVRERE